MQVVNAYQLKDWTFPNVNSFNFDGVDESIQSDAVMSTFDSSKKFSLSVWVKPTSHATTLRNVICNYRGGTASNFQWRLFLYEGNRIEFQIENTIKYLRGDITAITYGAWNHILVCMDTNLSTGNRGIMYVNGVDVTTLDNLPLNGTLLTATDRMEIADYAPQYSPFLGLIDEVALWADDVRAEVDDIYNGGETVDFNQITTTPDHWYSFDDATWGTDYSVPDKIGSADLTTVNMEEADLVTDIP